MLKKLSLDGALRLRGLFSILHLILFPYTDATLYHIPRDKNEKKYTYTMSRYRALHSPGSRDEPVQ